MTIAPLDSSFQLDVNEDASRFSLFYGIQPLVLEAETPLLPILDGAKPVLSPGKMRQNGDCQVFSPDLEPDGTLRDFHLFIQAGPDFLDLWCEFTVERACQLNALDIFSTKTGLGFYDVVNFRNRYFTATTWPELLIGQQFETTTYSSDWQFAPHPTALLLRKNHLSFFVGFCDLIASFGMRLAARQSIIERWDVNFGDSPHGLPLQAGEKFTSGRLRFFSRQHRSVHEIYTEFGEMLVKSGSIPDPAEKKRSEWWQEPIYCTWGDQWMLGNHRPPVELIDQTAASAITAVEQLSEDLIYRAVEVIKNERLPIRTIILDEGWQVARGDWRPHPTFKDFRNLVSNLHRDGFKVVVWWNWAEIAKDAKIPIWELAGSGWLNRHGNRWRDYSDPKIQENYLKPLFRKLFSPEPDCYDLDGVKTDFLADKVHPETPLHNLSWRGEERYFLELTRLFYREMRRHKPDALHLGCAGNYWLAEYIDLNRTYDVHSTNWLEHEERGKMLSCTTPGVPVSYDMMAATENIDQYFQSAKQLGASVEIGNVLVCRDHIFSPVRKADITYWEILRAGMKLKKT